MIHALLYIWLAASAIVALGAVTYIVRRRRSPRRHGRMGAILPVLIAAGALASTGAAAWQTFTSTVSGTGNGSLGNTTVSTSAVTINVLSSPPALNAGDNGNFSVQGQNNTTTARTIQSVGGTFTVSGATGTAGNGDNADCATHLHVNNGASNFVGNVIPASGLGPSGATINVSLDANAPLGCRSATWTVAFSGVTSP